MAFDLLVNASDQEQGLIDLATQLYFQHHRQLGIFNNPEIAELQEGGWLKKARQIIKMKEDDGRIRSMVVARDLIPKLLDNFKVRTFRPTARPHKLYQVYCTQWPNRRCKDCPHCVIEILEVRVVNTNEIKDSWARDAGCKDRKDLLRRLKEFGKYNKSYRNRKTWFLNTFKVVHSAE